MPSNGAVMTAVDPSEPVPDPIPKAEWLALLGTPYAHTKVPTVALRYVALVVVLLLLTKPESGGSIHRAAVEGFTGLDMHTVSNAMRSLVQRGVLIQTQRGPLPALYTFVPDSLVRPDPRSKGSG